MGERLLGLGWVGMDSRFKSEFSINLCLIATILATGQNGNPRIAILIVSAWMGPAHVNLGSASLT